MTSRRTHATNFVIAAATVAAIGASLLMPGSAGAAAEPGHPDPGAPWPEPPSCSNETFDCSPIEDWVAHECYFEVEDSPFSFCDDPFELQRQDNNRLTTPLPDPDPAPLKLTAPAGRR